MGHHHRSYGNKGGAVNNSTATNEMTQMKWTNPRMTQTSETD